MKIKYYKTFEGYDLIIGQRGRLTKFTQIPQVLEDIVSLSGNEIVIQYGKQSGSYGIIHDNQTGQSRGFGFVQFDGLEGYEIALTLNGSSLNRRKLKISPSEPKTILPSTRISTNATKSVDSTLTSEQKTRVVHCKKSNYDVYIGRPSIWGNPFVIGRDGDKADRIRKYRTWIMGQPELLARAKTELRGRTIACWCKPEACHRDILAEIADTD